MMLWRLRTNFEMFLLRWGANNYSRGKSTNCSWIHNLNINWPLTYSQQFSTKRNKQVLELKPCYTYSKSIFKIMSHDNLNMKSCNTSVQNNVYKLLEILRFNNFGSNTLFPFLLDNQNHIYHNFFFLFSHSLSFVYQWFRASCDGNIIRKIWRWEMVEALLWLWYVVN